MSLFVARLRAEEGLCRAGMKEEGTCVAAVVLMVQLRASVFVEDNGDVAWVAKRFIFVDNLLKHPKFTFSGKEICNCKQ